MLSKMILVWTGILLCALPSVRSFNNRFARLVSSDESTESQNTLGQDSEENRLATITLYSDESDDATTLSSIESDDAITISFDESDESRFPRDQEWETILDDLHLLGQVLDELKEVPLESSALQQEKLTHIEHQIQEPLEVREQNTNPAARKTLRLKH